MSDIHVIAAENQVDALARIAIVGRNRRVTVLYADEVDRAAFEDLRDELVGADIGPVEGEALFCIVARIR